MLRGRLNPSLVKWLMDLRMGRRLNLGQLMFRYDGHFRKKISMYKYLIQLSFDHAIIVTGLDKFDAIAARDAASYAVVNAEAPHIFGQRTNMAKIKDKHVGAALGLDECAAQYVLGMDRRHVPFVVAVGN
eukprot:m.165962 g.165962  ORF g.165962 m.165962 type:complete len:130 (-) comp16434_c1_seq7:845-1234(-)